MLQNTLGMQKSQVKLIMVGSTHNPHRDWEVYSS